MPQARTKPRAERILTIRLTMAQFAIVERLSASTGATYGAVVRRLVEGAAQRLSCEGAQDTAGRAWCGCARCVALFGAGEWQGE